jgi:hypothetical protein
MLSLIDATGRYTLPTGWHEVTTRQYCDLDRLQLTTAAARASYFAGRPVEVNELVVDALEWMATDVPLDRGLAYPQDLGKETFMQVESIRAMLLKQPVSECFSGIYGLMHGRPTFLGDNAFYHQRAARQAMYCLDWPITETYPTVAHCLAELQRLGEAFAALSQPDETEAGRKARAAGSDRLATFSHLNVARHYAERFGTTIDVIYQWPWQQVAIFMMQDRISAEVQDNLSQQND